MASAKPQEQQASLMRVFAPQQCQGTVLTGSFLNTDFQTFTYTGSLELSPADLADPNLSIVVSMQRCDVPGAWEQLPIAKEWQGGPGAIAPVVRFTGIARRVRLLIDILRTVGPPTALVGADINQTSN